jgi:nitroimidazol reductase NimA-like FMN-containing flavoprotein (pyridoxamine 5'-phosphate oxidase superfamily)
MEIGFKNKQNFGGPMRRNEREITDKSEISEILASNTICRIALSRNDTPYIVPMSYGYADGAIYLHSAGEGTKIDIIRENHRVCFEVTDFVEPVPGNKACDFSVRYRSVVGFGKIEIVEDIEEKQAGLNHIMRRHTGKGEWEIPEKAVSGVTVLKITIEKISGKQNLG